MNAIRTTHNLDFEQSDGFRTFGLDDGYGWKGFRIGTCEGLWSGKNGDLHILAIENKVPHNGHLDDVFEWFMGAAKRQRCALYVLEVMNPAMGRILLRKDFIPVLGTSSFKWTH